MIPFLLAAMVFMGLGERDQLLQRVDAASVGPSVQAQSVFVVSKDGQMLWSKQSLESRSIASLTKLMTAQVVLDQRPDFSKRVVISSRAARQPAVNLKLHAGDVVSLGDLWNAALIESANDAMYALIEGVGLTEEQAVTAMNKKVVDFNLVSTHFSDVTGLDPRDISNAEDVAVIFSQALTQPSIKATLARMSYVVRVNDGTKGARSVVVRTTNKLLGKYKAVIGGKTGYIEESGYNVAMVAHSSKGWDTYAIVLGAPSDAQRFASIKNSLAWVFSHYIMKSDEQAGGG